MASNRQRSDQNASISDNQSGVTAARSYLQQALSQLDQFERSPHNRQTLQLQQGPVARNVSPQLPRSSLQSTPTNFDFTQGQQVKRPSWMAERSSIFGNRSKKSKKVKLSMWEHDFICLASTDQTVPPSPMEKAELLRAGLGPRKLSLFVHGESSELHHDIITAFPKLASSGGYELLRTVPNNNKELCVIPPPSEGYTVEYLKNIVSQAKIYVRPIQKHISLDAPPSNRDMDSVPTETCLNCGVTIALCQLREHLKTCDVNLEANYSQCSPVLNFDNSIQRSPERSPQESLHASEPESPTSPSFSPISPVQVVTNESFVDLTYLEDKMIAQAVQESVQEREPKCLKDIVILLQNSSGFTFPRTENDWADTPKLSVDIRRNFVVVDILKEARKPRFDELKLLSFNFVGESGVDTGGLSREFWRLFVHDVVMKYCVGKQGICLFMKNVPALQKNDFFLMGKLTGMSILQGGCGFPVLHPAAYNYLATGDYLGQIVKDDDVPDLHIRQLLQEIDLTENDDQLRSLFTDSTKESILLETGFRLPLCRLTCADKELLKSTIRDYHSLVKIKPELDQFAAGLETVGVFQIIKKYPTLIAPLFVKHESSKKIDKDYFRSLFEVVYAIDPQRKCNEEATFVYFMDFIDDCEDQNVKTAIGEPVTTNDILSFFTGADCEPPLGFDRKPKLYFAYEKLASSSTCGLHLTLPMSHDKYENFKEAMILSLKGHDGFGKC